jgi:hypothetical protein
LVPEGDKKSGHNAYHLKVILVESLGQFMQRLGRGAKDSLRVWFVVVRGDECGAPGAEGTIGKEFHTADGEPFVETIVDKARYLGAPIFVRGNVSH